MRLVEGLRQLNAHRARRRHAAAPLPARARRAARRRGTIAVIAMLYMLLLTTLALAMYAVANTNVQTSENFSDISRAQQAAEGALRFMDFRFQSIARPQSDKGVINATVANTLWTPLRDAIKDDLKTIRGVGGTFINPVYSASGDKLTAAGLCLDSALGATCDVTVQQGSAALGTDARFVRVTCVGKYHRAARAVSMDFQMDKKVKFAVVGKVPIQLGVNTIVDGPVGMNVAVKYPPVFILSDFPHLSASLKTRIDNWNTYIEGVGVINGKAVKNHDGYDNRISINDPDEFTLARNAGYSDLNGDAFIDEYDLFFQEYDVNRDKVITKAEFTNLSTGKLYDEQLFSAIDRLSPPMLNEDLNKNGAFDVGEIDINGDGFPQWEDKRAGYDDGQLDVRDPYAKVKGQVLLATSVDAWNANLSSSGLNVYDEIRGPIASVDPTEPPVKFNATTQDVFNTSPGAFEQTALLYKAKTGAGGGVMVKNMTATPPIIENKVLAATDANGGTLTERTPYGSTSWQATYTRPKFVGVKFKNVQIPKGINALFDNCTFTGVTFVDTTRDIVKVGTSTVTTDKTDGMNWAKRMRSGSFANTTALTATNSYGFTDGNNIRFNDCTFEGPLVSPYATAYTHFANSWEFTGATYFNNKIDPTATIVAPQTNMEMGSFTNPAAAPSTLLGVVVAGNIDIRGSTTIDGSLIVTGDGAGNTTLGYFGNNDGETNPGAMPEGGYGKIYLRYNPFRPMPDGVLIAIDMKPVLDSYREGWVAR
jgi:Tfp pilus assembly protein PilX